MVEQKVGEKVQTYKPILIEFTPKQLQRFTPACNKCAEKVKSLQKHFRTF